MCCTSLLHCTVKAKNAVVWHFDCKTVCLLNCTSQRHCSLVTLSKWTKPALYKPKTLQPSYYQSNKKGSYHFLPFLYFWGLQEGCHIFFFFRNKHHVFCWQKIICVTKTQLQWNAFCSSETNIMYFVDRKSFVLQKRSCSEMHLFLSFCKAALHRNKGTSCQHSSTTA